MQKRLLLIPLMMTIIVITGVAVIGGIGGATPVAQNSVASSASAPAYNQILATSSPQEYMFTTTFTNGSGEGGGNVGGSAAGGAGGGAPGGGAGAVQTPRIVQVSQGITGTITNGEFETTALHLESQVQFFNGYIQSKDLIYGSDSLWHGTWTAEIPSVNSTGFLFNMRQLILQSGVVTGIEVKSQDVTAQTHGNASLVAMYGITITLDETPKAPSAPFGGMFSGALESLSTVGFYAVYLVLIGIPVYLGSLLVVFAAYKVFIPISGTVLGRAKRTPRTPPSRTPNA